MPEEFVTIASFFDLAEAELAKGCLESEGVEAFLADDNIVHLSWYFANAVGGVKLQVAREDAEIALRILGASPPALLPFREGDAYVQPSCPKCGAANVTYGNELRGVGLASLWAFSLPLPFAYERWKCGACGAEWSGTEGGSA